MAKKYIDAERFVEYFGDWYTEEGTELGFVGPIKDLVFRMPAVDVVEVCRCGECENWKADFPYNTCALFGGRWNENMFCSYGRRKDG